ncbi:unnamed protein product, partial [Rotaria sp. Silwood2]
YEAIKDKQLRKIMSQRLKELLNLLKNPSSSYKKYLALYLEVIEYLSGENYEFAQQLIDILSNRNHTLRPLFKEKVDNLKNILNSYINWYKRETIEHSNYITYEITITFAILGRILHTIKSTC